MTLAQAPRSEPQPGVEHKSALMVGTFLALWISALAYFGPRLWRLVSNGRTIPESVLLAAYCAMLVTFWLLAAYYIAIVLFSFLAKPLTPGPAREGDEWPAVAILYPTCNDLQEEAAASCLNQAYPNFHLFLLDDSTEARFRAAVDAFHAAHPEQTTVVRRPTRQGFKGGNLNHALHGPAAPYPFFTVVDADERMPPDLVQRTMAYMRDSDVSFVQANHGPNAAQHGGFAREIGATILPFWDVHCRPRNRYGLVLYLGHGATVRRSAWEAVGGFPQVVLEDLAFSAVLATQGMRGLFLDDLLCYEDFPATYLAFKRQHERYIIGTTQVMCKYLWPLLRSSRLSLTEKIDFCLWCSPLYVPALCLLFVALCSLGLAGVLGQWQAPVLSFFGHEFALPAIRTIDARFAPLWSWDFQLFSVLCALAPAFACIALGMRGRLHAVRLLFLSTVPYLSLMVVSWRGVLGYLLLGRTFSPPTGEQVAGGKDDAAQVAGMGPGYAARQAAPWRAPRAWELGIGSVLTVASLASFNLGLAAVSVCLLVGVLIETSGWERKLVRLAAIGCFAVILLQMLLNATLLVQSPGLVPLMFSIHF